MANDLLKHTFDQQAQLYRCARPRYPEELFDALEQITRLSQGARLLEIGPGTGQATESLARRGYSIIAVELGANLAALARETLKQYPNVEMITGAFEDVELPAESFDLVYAATAFHWLQPEAQFAKPFRILKAGGHLAVIDTRHVCDQAGDAFFFATQPIYQKYTPDFDENFRLPEMNELKPFEIDKNLFEPVFFRSFPLLVTYNARQYTDLLTTYSAQQAMEPDQREAFLAGIAAVINERFGGSIQHHFAMALTVARKIS